MIDIDRRGFIGAASATLGSASLSAATRVRRIATEEAFATPELVREWLAIARADPMASLDIATAINFIFDNPPAGSNPARFRRQLLDLDGERLAIMDAAGVTMHLLSVTIPGVQMSAPNRAAALAVATNDTLAAAIARHPTRFAGLACVAPQAPDVAPREMERAITGLKLNGFIINSHTNDRYLDDSAFAPVLEAARRSTGRSISTRARPPTAWRRRSGITASAARFGVSARKPGRTPSG